MNRPRDEMDENEIEVRALWSEMRDWGTIERPKGKRCDGVCEKPN